jgi:hypothetical protein
VTYVQDPLPGISEQVSCRCGHGTAMHVCRQRQSGRGCEWCGCGCDENRIKKLEQHQDNEKITALREGELGL